MKKILIVTLVLLLLLGVTSALAQTGGTYDLSWNTALAGGGWTFSSGGVYTLGGTAAQASTVLMSGGVYTLNGGFWSGSRPYLINIPKVFK